MTCVQKHEPYYYVNTKEQLNYLKYGRIYFLIFAFFCFACIGYFMLCWLTNCNSLSVSSDKFILLWYLFHRNHKHFRWTFGRTICRAFASFIQEKRRTAVTTHIPLYEMLCDSAMINRKSFSELRSSSMSFATALYLIPLQMACFSMTNELQNNKEERRKKRQHRSAEPYATHVPNRWIMKCVGVQIIFYDSYIGIDGLLQL